MPGWLTIAGREVDALLRLPVGWVVAALFSLLSGFVFATGVLQPGEPASMRAFFAAASWLLVGVCPAVSMRLLADELRSGTHELLRTGPVGDAAVVWGKYLGACAFLGLMLVPTLALPVALGVLAEPAPGLGPIAVGYLSLLMAGALYLAVGLVASCLTSSQTLAFLGALLGLVGVQLAVLSSGQYLSADLAERVLWLAVPVRVARLASGLIELRDLAFFLGLSVWAVVLAGVLMEARRWR